MPSAAEVQANREARPRTAGPIKQHPKGHINRQTRRHPPLALAAIFKANGLPARAGTPRLPALGGPVSASQNGIKGGPGGFSTKRSRRRLNKSVREIQARA